MIGKVTTKTGSSTSLQKVNLLFKKRIFVGGERVLGEGGGLSQLAGGEGGGMCAVWARGGAVIAKNNPGLLKQFNTIWG